MTMQTYHPRAARGVQIIAVLKSYMSRVLDLMTARRRRPPTYGVERLSDHMLRDIGLTRNDVDNLTSGQVSLEEIEALRRKL